MESPSKSFVGSSTPRQLGVYDSAESILYRIDILTMIFILSVIISMYVGGRRKNDLASQRVVVATA